MASLLPRRVLMWALIFLSMATFLYRLKAEEAGDEVTYNKEGWGG